MAAAALIAGGVAYQVTASPTNPPDCKDVTPPCPETRPETVLDSVWEESAIGFLFLPPSQGALPDIDVTEALNIAWKEGGVLGTSQQATLALVPKGGDFAADVLVWIVRYDGACISPLGGHRGKHTDECAVQPYWTIINAETGDFIMSWTRSE
jgi:hypothetical protein